MSGKWTDLQLAFDLELDEAADDAQERAISPAEARVISEMARGEFEGKQVNTETGRQGWGEEYKRLRELGWPWRVACYIAWAASPKNGRWPATLSSLATEVLGLTGPRVIYTWRKKFPAIDSVVAMMQAAPLFEHRRDVIQALIESAVSPTYRSFNDRKLFLEMTGDYTPKSKLELGQAGKASDLSELSDEELEALMGDQRPVIGDKEDEEEENDAADD